jgi:iron complex outermembrane receptor protein
MYIAKSLWTPLSTRQTSLAKNARPHAIALLCLWPLTISATPTAAQQPSLEDLLNTRLTKVPRDVEVSTASRVALTAAQSPSTTYVVSSQDIKLYGLRSLGDILATMPGLYLTNDGYFSYIGIRGLGRSGDYNSRLLFLIDGIRANENISDAGFLGSDALIDVESIERVEFATGPGSALYGNNAFFGVVNVITKGADRLRGVTALVSLSSQQQQQGRFSWAHRSDADWEAWFSGSISDWQHIPLPYPIANALLPYRSQLQNLEQENYHRLQAGLKIAGWQLQGALHQRQRQSPQPLGSLANLLLTQKSAVSDNHLLRASYQHEFSSDWELQSTLSSSANDYIAKQPFIGLQRSYTLRAEQYTTDVLQQQIVGHWQHLDLRLANRSFDNHLLLSGIEYQKDSRQRIENGLLGQTALQQFYSNNERKGIYLQDLWQLNAAHSLILGARYDKSRIAAEEVHPRLGWIWQQNDNSTLKLMYGSAFRAANLHEFSSNAPQGIPTPTPEQIRTTELSYEQFVTPQLNYRMTLFRSDIQHIIQVEFTDGYFVNGAPILSRGLELAVEQRFDQGQQLKANWSWQQSKSSAGQRPENSPTHLFNLQYNQPLTAKLQFALQLQAMSHRQMPELVLPGYVLVHSHLLWQSSVQTELALAFYNLTGTEYYDQPFVYAPPVRQLGRSLRLSLQWRFEP